MHSIHNPSNYLKKGLSITLFLFFIIGNAHLYGQQSIDKSWRAFDHAKNLYNNDLFLPSREAFENFILEYPDEANSITAKYFIASCAVRLEHLDGEVLMQNFVKAYPFDIRTKKAYLGLADHFYASKNYSKAISYYDLALENQATFSDQDYFQFGYSQFRMSAFADSKGTFRKIDAFSEYSNDAAYFIGYMDFDTNDYDSAKTNLEQAFDSKNYALEAIKMFAFILFYENNYQALVDLLDEESSGTNDADLLKLLADSYFELEQYRLAGLTYSELFKIHKKFRTYESYYRAGVSYLKTSNLEESIDNLKRAALSNDSLGAYASYQLGVLYTNNNNLLFASSAFANAAQFDTRLKEESRFLQGKIEFDLKNYDQSITHLTLFQTDFPSSEHHDLVNEMLSEAYLNTKNYERAITYIESLKRLSIKTKSAYQRVTFLKAMDLYNANRYQESIDYFKKSLTYSTNGKIEADAFYHIGEAYSKGKKYSDAKFYYEEAFNTEVKPTAALSLYSLGYVQYNLQNYAQALNTFQKFDRNYSHELNIIYKQDALVRMGDCAYVLKMYDESIESYDKALTSGSKQQAYIYFQKGLVYRYGDNIIESKKSFNVILSDYTNSDKADDALFQISQIDFEAGNYQSTIEKSKKLINNYPESKYLPYALLNEAVAQNNMGNSEVSIKSYKSILDRFPRHATANSALLGLQGFSGAGSFDDFDNYLSKYKLANPKSEALENIDFETAKALFYNQKYEAAIASFSKFKESYSKSVLLIDANYFLADSWYRKKNPSKALEYYYLISDIHDYPKYRRIQQRIADLERENENFIVSNDYYQSLKNSQGNFKDLNNSNFGLLSNYFDLAQYDSAIFYGNEVLDGSRVPNDLISSTYLLLGKSNYNIKNYDAAVDWFVLLLNDSPDERGAEAKYYVSKILFEKGEYNNSLQSLFAMKDEYRLFDQWVGKAFLLMSDNYLALDELFQAKATLNSLIENIEIESIKKEAKLKLSQIENQEMLKKSDTLNNVGN